MKKLLNECLNNSKDLKILYVEDNADARTFTMEMLKRFFKYITVAKDGEEGLSHFKNKNFDLVLTDIKMPKLSGLEMASEMKKINKNIPILVLSAHNETDFFISSIKLGIDGYLLKPLEINQFIDTLAKTVEKIKLHKEIETYKLALETANANLELKVKERTSKLEHRLYHDQLTELSNHEAMMQNIGQSSNEIIYDFLLLISIIMIIKAFY